MTNAALAICLAFLSGGEGKSVLVPDAVDKLVKARVTHQLEERHPGLRVLFDQDMNCPERGRYLYTADSFVIEGDGLIFNGRLEKLISEIIDGKSFDLSTVMPQIPDANPMEVHGEQKSNHALMWTAAGLGLGVLSFFLIRNMSTGPDGDKSAPLVLRRF